jgi:hypothetical protein
MCNSVQYSIHVKISSIISCSIQFKIKYLNFSIWIDDKCWYYKTLQYILEIESISFETKIVKWLTRHTINRNADFGLLYELYLGNRSTLHTAQTNNRQIVLGFGIGLCGMAWVPQQIWHFKVLPTWPLVAYTGPTTLDISVTLTSNPVRMHMLPICMLIIFFKSVRILHLPTWLLVTHTQGQPRLACPFLIQFKSGWDV